MTEAETILTPWLQPGETLIRAFRPVPKPRFRWYRFLIAFGLILLGIHAFSSTRKGELITLVWQNATSAKEILLALFAFFIFIFLFLLCPVFVCIIAPSLIERSISKQCYGITSLGILWVIDPIPPATWWNRFQYKKEVFSPRTLPFSYITKVHCEKPNKDASANVILHLTKNAKKSSPFLILSNIENPESIAALIRDLQAQGATHEST